MTKQPSRPHLGICPLCEQGLIRIAKCPHCEQWTALCDECEALWAEPAVITKKPNGQHPDCPHCHAAVKKWTFGTLRQLSKAGFGDLIRGESE